MPEPAGAVSAEASAEVSAPNVVPEPTPGRETPEFRLIGALSRRYLLLDGGEGLVMLDQRAARQRILFERLQRGVAAGAVSSQRLLVPEVFDLPPRELESVKENLRVLEDAGFGVEVFGGRSLKVEALPDFLAGRDPRRVMEDFAAECLAGGASRVRGAWAEDAVRRAVVRLGTGEDAVLDEAAQRLLVTHLLACELPYCDPEGRPVMLQFSWRELERKFGRS
jgi:DNA mismatch repair protein MutL